MTVTDELRALRTAVTQLEKLATKRLALTQTRLLRRNARRDVFGAIKSINLQLFKLRAAMDAEFPAIAKPTTGLDAKGRRALVVDKGDWRRLLVTLPFGPIRKGWNRDVALAFIAHWAMVNKRRPPMLIRQNTKYWWRIVNNPDAPSIDDWTIALPSGYRKAEECWQGLIAGLAELTVPRPHGRRHLAFTMEIHRVFEEFKFFRKGDSFHLALRTSFAGKEEAGR